MLTRLFLYNPFLLSIISLNALVIFVHGFYPSYTSFGVTLEVMDHFFTFLFLVEAMVKWQHLGTSGYFKDGWNLFDFLLVVVALPSLLLALSSVEMFNLDFLLALRILRVFKFFRVLKFVPNVEHLILGIIRAIRSSILIVFAFFIFNFIFAILSFSFFSELAPEHFGNPLIAFYTTFKVFTIEGWYEIPDLIAERTDNTALAVFARVYFVALLFGGGIFGLSLINSIFVESMMSDNNDEVLEKVKSLDEKLNRLLEENKHKG